MTLLCMLQYNIIKMIYKCENVKKYLKIYIILLKGSNIVIIIMENSNNCRFGYLDLDKNDPRDVTNIDIFDTLVPLWGHRKDMSPVEKSLLMSLAVASNIIIRLKNDVEILKNDISYLKNDISDYNYRVNRFENQF